MNLVIFISCQDSQNEIPSTINLNPDLHVLVGSLAACVTALDCTTYFSLEVAPPPKSASMCWLPWSGNLGLVYDGMKEVVCWHMMQEA